MEMQRCFFVWKNADANIIYQIFCKAHLTIFAKRAILNVQSELYRKVNDEYIDPRFEKTA
jgi:hypothetical protein